MADDEAKRPTVLIVDDEALNREFASRVLNAAGWRVATAAGGEEAVVLLRQLPSLVLMDLHMAGMSGAETVAAIRRRDDRAADVAILAYTTTPQLSPRALFARGFDGFVPKPCTADELARAAARWLPQGADPLLTRLEQGFGVEHIRGMTARFRDLLVEALGALDGPEPGAIAHRVAGIAGAIGFAAVGRAWLALSDGDESHLANARCEARRAIMAIGLHLKD